MTVELNYGVKPVIANPSLGTYSTEEISTGDTVNLFCVAGLSKDGKKIKVEPFTYDSQKLIDKVQVIAQKKLLATLQKVNIDGRKHVILQVDPSFKKLFVGKPCTLVTNDASESKICNFTGILYFNQERYDQAEIMASKWYQAVRA